MTGMKHGPLPPNLKAQGKRLPFYAWIWRRRVTSEVLEMRRCLRAYRDTIHKHQASLAARVTGIDEALALLGQAADRLAKTADETQRPPRRKGGSAASLPRDERGRLVRRAPPAPASATPGGLAK